MVRPWWGPIFRAQSAPAVCLALLVKFRNSASVSASGMVRSWLGPMFRAQSAPVVCLPSIVKFRNSALVSACIRNSEAYFGRIDISPMTEMTVIGRSLFFHGLGPRRVRCEVALDARASPPLA
ncbi:hypothetical protein B0H14DRAFT_967835 [Mycena olivaceomarginata]|nr:hypothetical protein B0H14DRAFT_967835 [Mycena olivaceomarginata]